MTTYAGFVKVASQRRGNSIWKFFQPHLKQLSTVVQSVIGYGHLHSDVTLCRLTAMSNSA